MHKQQRTLILLIVLSLGLLVLFLMLPKRPASMAEKESVQMDPDSLKLSQAIELVNGPSPMQGITILRELVAKDSNNVDAHYWLGVFSVKSGQLDKAINRFEKVLGLNPQYMPAMIDLGGVYQQMDSSAVALKYFTRAKELDTTNNYALLFSAQVQERMGLWKEAKENYEQLLRHNSDTIVAKRVNEFIENIDHKLNP
jgi:tetratricopeptide (TPR) repeat protein